MISRAIPFLMLASFVAAGCASGGHVVPEVEQLSPLTEADLADYPDHTALGVIRILRPEWVATNTRQIKVFLGPSARGGLDQLESLMAREVREIRFHPQRQTTGNHSTYAYVTVTLKG